MAAIEGSDSAGVIRPALDGVAVAAAGHNIVECVCAARRVRRRRDRCTRTFQLGSSSSHPRNGKSVVAWRQFRRREESRTPTTWPHICAHGRNLDGSHRTVSGGAMADYSLLRTASTALSGCRSGRRSSRGRLRPMRTPGSSGTAKGCTRKGGVGSTNVNWPSAFASLCCWEGG